MPPSAGQPADASILVDVARLVSAYYTIHPDPYVPAQRVAFGTSGHRGSSFAGAFNEHHILAIAQAICEVRRQQGTTGPLLLGMDTHALSVPAFSTALEVFAANAVEVVIDATDDFTPTPVISHAIIAYNRRRTSALADGIVITPSHNPPTDGGFKYNPPHGGPAGAAITQAIERRANEVLVGGLQAVRRMPLERALRAATTRRYDYRTAYVSDLEAVIDFAIIRDAKLRIGVDPMGGAGVHYWAAIAERYAIDLTVVDDQVDPTFRFMTVDHDGRIRMDPSSPWAMQRLIGRRGDFDIAFACDTDHDRHGVVTRSVGLMPPNHYLAVAIRHLVTHRHRWSANAAIGKTIVSSDLIDRVVRQQCRRLVEVPVGFKWFVDGLHDGSLVFAGEESAGAAFARMDGAAWTTDKDGIVPGLLAAELTARTGRDPGEQYRDLVREVGEPLYARTEAAAGPEQKAALARLTSADVRSTTLAGDRITRVLTEAPGNGAPIGGIKVASEHGWFAARPSGTESIYKIYAESFRDAGHLERIQHDAHAVVSTAIGGGEA